MKLGKDEFIGRAALLQQKASGVRKRLLQFKVTTPEPLLYHNEPIWRGDVIVGFIRSGMYGHTLGGAVGLGYVQEHEAVPLNAPIDAGAYEIEIAGRRHAALASLKPFYDPHHERVKR